MKSQLLERLVLLALVLGMILFVLTTLAPKIQGFAEKAGKSIERPGVEQAMRSLG
jgi:hypothetical protein